MLNFGEMKEESGISSRLVTCYKVATVCFTFLRQVHQRSYIAATISAHKIFLITYLDLVFPSKYWVLAVLWFLKLSWGIPVQVPGRVFNNANPVASRYNVTFRHTNHLSASKTHLHFTHAGSRSITTCIEDLRIV